MADRGGTSQRPPRAPLSSRSRRRWAIAGGVAAGWLLLVIGTGSALAGTAVFFVIAVVAALCLVALRSLGIDRDHPAVQRLGSRPWRDGRDVLRLALRQLPEVFLVTPSGSLLAPNLVELHMSPDDFDGLSEIMDQDMIDACATESYLGHLGERGARLGGPGPARVHVAGDPAVPPGRFRLRQGRPVQGGPLPAAPSLPAASPAAWGPAAAGIPAVAQAPAPAAAPDMMRMNAGGGVFQASDGQTRTGPAGARALATDLMTVTEPAQAPLLRLITGGSAVQTRVSGARAGRGASCELLLPEEPTLSRLHAKFTCDGGQWRVTALGRNGLMVNDRVVTGEQPLRDGDLIRWGRQTGSLVSAVQIGPG
jgi:FHA domain-containing protein